MALPQSKAIQRAGSEQREPRKVLPTGNTTRGFTESVRSDEGRATTFLIRGAPSSRLGGLGDFATNILNGDLYIKRLAGWKLRAGGDSSGGSYFSINGSAYRVGGFRFVVGD